MGQGTCAALLSCLLAMLDELAQLDGVVETPARTLDVRELLDVRRCHLRRLRKPLVAPELARCALVGRRPPCHSERLFPRFSNTAKAYSRREGHKQEANK